jgi:hypothetical protein
LVEEVEVMIFKNCKCGTQHKYSEKYDTYFAISATLGLKAITVQTDPMVS